MGLFSGITKVVKKALPYAAAATGFAVGGPAGAAIGYQAGNMLTGAGGSVAGGTAAGSTADAGSGSLVTGGKASNAVRATPTTAAPVDQQLTSKWASRMDSFVNSVKKDDLNVYRGQDGNFRIN